MVVFVNGEVSSFGESVLDCPDARGISWRVAFWPITWPGRKRRACWITCLKPGYICR